MLELSTTIKGISTSPNGRQKLTPKDATRRAKAHLRYIVRPSAVEAEMWLGVKGQDGRKLTTAPTNRRAARSAIRKAFATRATQGGKNGARIAEKLMFSLPNTFPPKARKEALARVIMALVEDSDASAYGVIHQDKPHNTHAHVILVDGRESERQARQRNPNAKRLRRQQKLRFGDLGRPKDVRKIIAEQINAVAKTYGLDGVEHRSFKDRKLPKVPTQHRGPIRTAIRIAAHKTEQARRNIQSIISKNIDKKENSSNIMKNIQER